MANACSSPVLGSRSKLIDKIFAGLRWKIPTRLVDNRCKDEWRRIQSGAPARILGKDADANAGETEVARMTASHLEESSASAADEQLSREASI